MTAKNNFLRLLATTASIAVLATGFLVVLLATQPAKAAFPGANGRIVFERDPDGFRGPKDPEIYSINFNGDNLRRLTDNATGDTQPSFSADGTKIVYSGGDGRAWDSYKADIFVMKANGFDKTRLTKERQMPGASTADDLQPAFSPSGRQIVFVRNGPLADGHTLSNDDIYTIRTDGTNPKRLVDIPSFEYYSGGDPAWSPDGQKIAYFSGAEADYSIETIRPDGTPLKTLTTGYDPNWSPDGSRIAFDRSAAGSGSRIYVADADGTDEIPLPTQEGAYDSEPAFSPGGGKVVFASNRDGDYDLYITTADGSGEPQQLTNYPGDERSPDWQPVQ